MPEKDVVKPAGAQIRRLWLVERELDAVGPFMWRSGRCLAVRRTAMVADPETLTGLIHDLTLVGGDKLPIGRDGVCQAHTHRLQAGYVVVAHRHTGNWAPVA